tara:strand:+ start:108 stop:623 length:516 start_codon:yes stop_codon:yes gene_type:complete
MGQGTESCGGYEVEYDPYDYNESDSFSIWHGRDGDYKVRDMSNPHIESVISMCEDLSLSASFSCESEKWEAWVDSLNSELFRRSKNGIYIERKPRKKSTSTKQSRVGDGKKVENKIKSFTFKSNKQEMTCHCGANYTAKVADLKRGWALSCSKRCAAIRRDYGRPSASIKS